MVKLLKLAMLGLIWLDLQCWGDLVGFMMLGVIWLDLQVYVCCDTLNLLCVFTKNHPILYNKHV